MENTNTPALNIPEILTSNTYRWTPSASADARRRSEKKRIAEVESFFFNLGFSVSSTMDTVKAEGFSLEIEFYYQESARNVYKSLSVYKDGKRSNIKALTKLVDSLSKK